MRTRSPLLIALTIIVLLLASGVYTGAVAKYIIHVNKGFGGATLSMTETAAVKALGLKPSKSGKDTEYEGRVVYYKMFGKAYKNGEYPIEMYSDTKRRVFIFAINSSSYPTDAGIKVGSTEAQLKKAYGKALRSKPGRIYTRYWLGDKTGTDFYIKKGVITQIIVHKY